MMQNGQICATEPISAATPAPAPNGGLARMHQARFFVTGALGGGSAAVLGRAAEVWRYQRTSPEMRLTEPATITTPNR